MRKWIRRAFKAILGMAIIAMVISGVFIYWNYRAHHPATDDAYVQANVINIAAQVNGPVAEIYVENYSKVKKGQPLFTIDPAPFQIAVAKAKANLANIKQQVAAEEAAVITAREHVKQSQAQLDLIKKDARRTLILVQKKLDSVAAGDKAHSDIKVAVANLEAAKSQLQQALATLGSDSDNNAQIQAAKAALQDALLQLSYTKVYAPATGYVSNFNLRVGSMVSANQPLFALIDNGSWWVNANFQETQLQHIRIGQSVKIELDMYPDHLFKGVVENINRGSGAAFSILPPENATGNWVKVTQRFTVKVRIVNPDPRYPLRIGASSNVTIN